MIAKDLRMTSVPVKYTVNSGHPPRLMTLYTDITSDDPRMTSGDPKCTCECSLYQTSFESILALEPKLFEGSFDAINVRCYFAH